MRPVGKCKVVGFKSGTPNAAMVHVIVKVEDEEGNLWEYPAPYMLYDLKPHCATQDKDFSSWKYEITSHRSWWMVRLKVEDETFVKWYRLGYSTDYVLKNIESLLERNERV